jgi:ProP effector
MAAMSPKQRLSAYLAVRPLAAAAFPCAFSSRRRRPLALGSFEAVARALEGQASRTRVRAFLAVWTRSTAYLKSVAKGGPRYTLDGIPSGTVAEAHRAAAISALAARGEARGGRRRREKRRPRVVRARVPVVVVRRSRART